MGSPALVSFNAGELSPLMDARLDVAKYRSGCQTLQNMIPRKYGPAMRRPGFKYIASQSDESKQALLVPFEYSSSVAYVICFEEYLNRYFTSGARLESGGSPVETVTPYIEAHLRELQFTQSNDVMWITHNSYAQRKLSRTSTTAFSLDAITFTNGPFRTRNDILWDDDVTLTPSVTTGSGTLTLSATTNFSFQSGHVGALMKIVHPRVNTDTDGTLAVTGVLGSAILVEGTATMTLNGVWSGKVKLQKSYDGSTWETVKSFKGASDSRFSHVFNETEENVQYRMNVTEITSGSVTGNITLDDSEQFGVCRITAYNSTTSVDMTVIKDFAATSASKRWAEGAWSDVRGYPKTFTFYGDRAIYAATTDDLQTLWLSKVGEYENFKAGTDPSDSFAVEILSRERNAIQWISGMELLVIGTTGGEWILRATTQDEPVTPTNWVLRQQSNYGSKNIQSGKINKSVIFVDLAGRKLRQMDFIGSVQQAYEAPDLTVFCDHLTNGEIVDFAVQRYPEPIVWMVTGADPYFIGLSTDKEQDLLAGARYPAGGSGVVESVAVIHGSEEDEVWASIQRTVNGSTVRTIEQMQPWARASQSYAWFVDSGVISEGTDLTTVTVSHLIGETVKILGDGVKYPEQVVPETGIVPLAEPVDVAIVGLGYEWIVKPMKLDTDSLFDTTRGTTKSIGEISANFYETLGATYGDGTTQYEIEWPRPLTLEPITLFTGDIDLVFDSEITSDTSVVLSGTAPYPCTLRSLTVKAAQEGR